MREDDYKLSMEKLYQQNRLLISALHEIYGEEIQSTSLFCLAQYDSSIENGIYFFEPLISFNDFSIEL